MAKRNKNVAEVALANKNARIVWALLAMWNFRRISETEILQNLRSFRNY